MSRPRENPRKILKNFPPTQILKKLENCLFRLGLFRSKIAKIEGAQIAQKCSEEVHWFLRTKKFHYSHVEKWVICRDIVWEINFWLESPNQIKISELIEWDTRKILVLISTFYDHQKRRYSVITFFMPGHVKNVFYDSWWTFLGKFCCK